MPVEMTFFEDHFEVIEKDEDNNFQRTAYYYKEEENHGDTGKR